MASEGNLRLALNPRATIAAMAKFRLAVAATAAFFALIPASEALAARGMEVAIQDDQVLVNRVYYDRDKALGQAEDLQVSRIRVNLRWASAVGSSINRRKRPKRIRYDWRRWDDLIAAAGARGIKVQLALTGDAPRWATGNRRVGPVRPNSKYYAQFAQDAARHFKGRVDRYSIWNEPNHVGWIAPKRKSASIYRSLYKRGYRAIKAADPDAQVLFGELAPYASKASLATPPLAFLRQVTCVNRSYRQVNKRCGRFEADGFAHHPYEYRNPPNKRFPGRDNVTMSGLPKLTKALDRLARRRIMRTPDGRALDLYLTEFGYFSRGKYKLPDKTRAKYLVKAFDMAQRNPRVKEMLQYLLVQPARVHAFFDTSIVSRKGKLSRTFRKLKSWAAKAAKKGKIVAPEPPPPPPPPQEPPPQQEPAPVPAPAPAPPEPEPAPAPPPPPPCDLTDPLCVVPTI